MAATESGVACDAPGVSPSAPRLLMTVTNIRHAGGNITFTLYGDDPAKFLAHHGSIDIMRVPVTANSVQGCFALSGPGTYAVAIYDDANNNHRFDKTFLGLPAEDYGFSNNPRNLLAPPGFHAVAFTVTAAGAHITMSLHPF
ncbi:DUF2141 domain-containing protein [Acidisoma cellulosilytica]|uniref:DUF2141 domain-containing protein n=1 Tax=Acidisoma cellulosilyticum TaxID=2802395 RepID=A0A963Z5K4_9PROT|nr:DUF2141 domain-containing protein [Acidisoma cellulosilyticum]MCB8882455.1 DUF2141 domain-containing protein [Acidisoma cellulosilyticum]